MKLNKNIKIFVNYFLGPVLFVWLSWSIYKQVSSQADLHRSWQHTVASLQSVKAVVYLVVVMLLMLVNYGIEAYKWRLAISRIQPISFVQSCKAVLSGVSLSISTPNNVGGYVGRVLYVSEGNRIKAATLTVVTNLSQQLITAGMGLVGLFFLKEEMIQSKMLSPLWMQVLFYVTAFGFVLAALFYFRLSWLVKIIDRLPESKRFSWSIEALEHFNATLLLRFLSLSALRFVVFILQYFLLFKLFELQIDWWHTVAATSVLFLILAIIPTIALFTDLGIRNEAGLKLFGLFSANHLGISLAAFGIWFINLIVPALVGSILILGVRKIFKNKDEST